MKSLKVILFAVMLAQLSSCAFLKRFEVHEKVYTQLDKEQYAFTMTELKQKVISHLEYTGMDGKMIILNMNSAPNMEQQMEVKEALDDGFIYKDRLYVSVPTFDMSWLTTDTAKLKDKILKSKFHTLEENENGFTIVKGDNVYEASKNTDGKTSLRVFKITRVYRPLDFKIDWLSMIKGRNWLDIGKGPVDLVSSRQYQVRDRAEELSIFYRIDQDRAEKMEAELLSTI